jgi:hypothetical protein
MMTITLSDHTYLARELASNVGSESLKALGSLLLAVGSATENNELGSLERHHV